MIEIHGGLAALLTMLYILWPILVDRREINYLEAAFATVSCGSLFLIGFILLMVGFHS